MNRVVIVIEQMPKRERVLPTKHWRVAERAVVEKDNGQVKMLKQWKLVKRDLNYAGALHELQCARIQRFNEIKKPDPIPA